MKYRCEEVGITFKEVEESYTSKCSAIDNEEVKKHNSYYGKRVKRGLFESFYGYKINADVNGAINILRKVTGTDHLFSDFDQIKGIMVYPDKVSEKIFC